MIPISKDDKVIFTDEKSGVVYETAPIIGEKEKEFYKIGEAMSKTTNQFDVDALGKLFDPFIDSVLLGWKGENIPAFPADGKPSAMFKTLDKVDMYNAISKHNKLTASEQKN